MGKTKVNNPNIELRDLKFNLYLDPSKKKQFIRIFDLLTETHDQTINTVYKHLLAGPDEVEKIFIEEFEAKENSNFNPDYFDYGDYMEEMQNYVWDRLDEQYLMLYQFKLMSLSNLYQVFEQQLRKWLYEEITHRTNEHYNQVKFNHVSNGNKNTFDSFLNNFGKLRDSLEELNLTFTNPSGSEELIVDTNIWKIIRECNLLSNTFKHGSGSSAENLYKLCSEYFEKVNKTRLMDFYRTTNLERVLNVEKISFEKYSNAMQQFWINMKEHQRCSIKMNVDISSKKQ
ncbi:hypothetical protein JIN86_04830 [Lysinibacillus sp. HST-98]|uniref:hypothetical protein n=1 Tax=Lysinibacillus sp. HST-98 TaxID=2800419 RepID=UPI001928DEBA|nr:hypothetical protein [Lysinibacillus sp. HST-98]MBL3728934.1 hypothetical protein [Lysinibacillus sp. HST-98]